MTDNVLGYICSLYKDVLSFTFCQFFWFLIQSYHLPNHSEERLISFLHLNLLQTCSDNVSDNIVAVFNMT